MTPPDPPKSPKHPGTAWIAFALGLASALFLHWQTRKHFVPGQWPGRQGMIPIEMLSMLAAVVAMIAIVVLLVQRAGLRAICVLLVATVPCLLPVGNAAVFRYRTELPRYKQAITTGTPYGDQHAEKVDGRTLTYWRWMSWGIDNGLGVIHDPEQRLMEDGDTDIRAFEDQTGGVIFRVTPIEPGWYYVSHS